MHPASTLKNVNVSSPSTRGRWTTVVGVLVPLFILVGGVVSGGLADNLSENAGAMTVTAIQLPALLTAIVAGGLGAPGHSAPTNPGPS